MDAIRTSKPRLRSREIKDLLWRFIRANTANVHTLSCRQIAALTGVSKSSVSRYLPELLLKLAEVKSPSIVKKAKPPKKRRDTEIMGRLRAWLRDKLDGDWWASYSYREIGMEIGASHHAVRQNLLTLVAKMTGRQLDEVRRVRKIGEKRHYTTPFVWFCIQQLHDRGRSVPDIIFLTGFSRTTVRNCIKAPRVGRPATTEGSFVRDELWQVLEDELRISIKPSKS